MDCTVIVQTAGALLTAQQCVNMLTVSRNSMLLEGK